jgi:peptidyl-dipeptidase Dcp
MKLKFSRRLCSAMLICGMSVNAAQAASGINPHNPFLHPSTLDYQAPAFDKIKNSDYLPALQEGMKRHLAQVNKIANNPAPATFENTLVALEKSGTMLTRVSRVFFSVAAANNNPTLQKIQEKIAPELAAHQDAIYLNDKLFQRIKSLHDKTKSLNLDGESLRLLNYYFDDFIHAGANLSAADKVKLKALNKENATFSATFVNKLLDGTKAAGLVVDNKAELAGLSDGAIQAAAADAKTRGLKGKWLLPLQNTTQQPALGSLTNRATREKLFQASWTRSEKGDKNDTRKTIAHLAKIRAEKAALLGFSSYAAWTLQDQMAKTPEAVTKLLKKLAPATTAHAKEEAADIQKVIDNENKNFKLQPWDWELYAEKVRKARYNLDENEVKPYFELNRVLKDGVFYAATKLYGITFKERNDLPVYQEDVKVYELFNADGSSIGLFYTDYFKRDNKSGGAWMDNMVGQSYLLGTKPVIYNVTNFTKPAKGQPALISWDDVTTMFHEFGHALHGFFADQQYPSLSGTNTARDFVEFPSQFNEHWASYPSVFKHFARHYKTGKPMPDTLVKKLRDAAYFNQGYALTELLAAADLDMAWHSLPATAPEQDVDKFEVSALKDAGLYVKEVPPRYRSSYFMHIWGNGYSAGYYAYLWTEMLDDDAYTWFEENGGLTRKNGERFRKMILSRGNTLDYGEMFKAFRGRDPIIEPMLKNRGLIK